MMFQFRQSDRAIVRRTMEGNPQAFETLVFRYQVKAHAIARAMGLRQEEVEDAVQEAFLQAFRDLPSLREPGSFGGWFLNIVRHVSIKEVRRRAAKGGGGASPAAGSGAGKAAPSAAEEAEQQDFREYLWRKVAALPQGTREAIFLYYYEGESVRAVARSLGLSVSGTKKRLRVGREELREKLWRGLERSLRETLPSAGQWRASGRRLGLLVLGSIPAAWTARAGALAPRGGGNAIEALTRSAATAIRCVERPSILASKKALLALAALILIVLGGAGWITRAPGGKPAAGTAALAPRVATTPRAAEAEPSAKAPPAETPGVWDDEVEVASAEEASDEENRGSVVVRVIWGEDRTPAAGVSGQVIPWGSPDLYIDERTFTSGPDGTAQVDHIFRGGASVLLDRGGRADVHVLAGEAREAIVEVPPGFNVQGVVVDRDGSPVGGARVWISYSGHTNWGTEVATTLADGTFFVRSISATNYIAARARGHVASDLRTLKGDAGTTVDVRLVLNGAGGELVGTVRDETGEPVPHAKVMAGAEYASYTLLDDGATGLSPPPYVGFTDGDGMFHADSLPPGRTRLAVRAPGFVPLEEEVDVLRGSVTAAELTLRRGATLSGNVTGPDGQPITGAQVVVGDFRDFLSIKVFSGDGGSYRLRGLRPGDIEAYAQRPGRGKASTRLTVSEGETARWDPVLVQDLEIRGRLMDESSFPLEGFVLLLEEEAGRSSRRATQKKTTTDAAGRFTVGELSDLSYRITIHESETALPCALLEKIRAGSEELEVRIERTALASAHVLGHVLDDRGEPYPGAKVICYSSLGGYRVGFTGKEGGAFRLGPLPTGRYTVEIQAVGHLPLAIGEHEIEPGEERDLGTHYLGPALR